MKRRGRAVRENRFYVYAHRRADDDTIFYIGKGWGNRAKSGHRRTAAWDEVCAEAGGFKIEIIASELGDIDSREIEAQQIDKHWGALVNKRRRDLKPVTAAAREKVRVDVDAELLAWLKDWQMSRPAIAPFNRILDACIRGFMETRTAGPR